jgi:AraC family transcriptional regulator, regulatory protein of adaptative response / DNA-3-methyladenine glycosylase II
MTLDPEICWRAWTARDARFVGRFVMGVTSTHIYCRPGCPARLPARRNVRFYATPAAAEAAGFRACLRCRPDRAPGAASASGTTATVSRALRLIDEGALADGSLETLSDRLGVTSRWLRELFERHVGAAPLDVARTRQAHLARRLLEETPLPVEDVAAAAGYGSARRLRAAFQQAFRCAPASLRGGRAPATEGGLSLRLPARPPFDAAPTLAFLATRAIPGVEEIRDGEYRRTFTLAGRAAVLGVRPYAAGVELRLPAHAAAAVPRVLARVSRLFDLDADAGGSLDLGAFRDLDDAVAKLTALPGIGDWTAQYLAMRALGEPDAFPAGDLGVRQALQRSGRLPSERETRERAERWRPWRAYAVLALWTEPKRPRSTTPKRKVMS